MYDVSIFIFGTEGNDIGGTQDGVMEMRSVWEGGGHDFGRPADNAGGYSNLFLVCSRNARRHSMFVDDGHPAQFVLGKFKP